MKLDNLEFEDIRRIKERLGEFKIKNIEIKT